MAENRKEAVIFFGDSNTYGAHGFSGGRYETDERWTGLIAGDAAWAGKFDFINMGENGRTIPEGAFDLDYSCRAIARHGQARLVTVMLGSNDLLTMFRPDAEAAARKMEIFLKTLMAWEPEEGEEYERPFHGFASSSLLLIAPPPTQLARYGAQGAQFDRISQELAGAYFRIAQRYGMHFANADDWNVALGADGVHFTAEGHQSFARGLAAEIRENGVLDRNITQ